MKKLFVYLIGLLIMLGYVYAETVDWTASSVGSDAILILTVTPSSTISLTSWIVEHINIPSGWILHSVDYNGGSGLGAQGCNQESGYLNCAAAGSTPADVPTTLAIKLKLPSTTSSGTLNGKYTTISTSGTINNGNLNQITINDGYSTSEPSSSGGSWMVIGIVVIGIIIYFVIKKR